MPRSMRLAGRSAWRFWGRVGVCSSHPLSHDRTRRSKLETYGRIARGCIGLGLQPVALQGGGRVEPSIVRRATLKARAPRRVSTRGISS